MRPIRCILSFHKTELIRAFLQKGDVMFGRPSNYVSLRVSQCKRCKWYLFEVTKIIHGEWFNSHYWQSDLSEEDRLHIYYEPLKEPQI